MESIKITDVRALPGDSAFLIDNGKTAILYDSGFAFTGYKVADRIKAILGNRNLDYIFLTHSHYDHALGSVYALKYWPNAKVVAGEYAAKIFAKPTAKAVMRELDNKFAAKNGITEYEDLIDELHVDITVKDGDVITVGDMEFAVLHLPGHTRCSIAFYCEKEKLLLGCETTGVFNGADDVVPSYLVGYEMTMNSINRVTELSIENVLIPHYGLLDKAQTEIYLKKAKVSAEDTANKIVEMLKNGKTKDDALQYFKDRFYYGYVSEIYPVDAMELNTGIMIDLLIREFDILIN